jgi:hypothetical protein
MKATRLLRDKKMLASGAIIEMVIWKLPEPEVGRPHGYKYRLYYGRHGKRLMGYDNERGKSDHRHYGDHEEAYRFSSLDKLIEDFLADVAREEEQ